MRRVSLLGASLRVALLRLVLTFVPRSHRRQHTDATIPVASFPLNASGKDLIGHCEESHPAACESLATLRPEEVAEMRQRLGKM